MRQDAIRERARAPLSFHPSRLPRWIIYRSALTQPRHPWMSPLPYSLDYVLYLSHLQLRGTDILGGALHGIRRTGNFRFTLRKSVCLPRLDSRQLPACISGRSAFASSTKELDPRRPHGIFN